MIERLPRCIGDVAESRRLVRRKNERRAGKSGERAVHIVFRQGHWRRHSGRVSAGGADCRGPAGICRGPACACDKTSGFRAGGRVEGFSEDATGAAPHVSEPDRILEHRWRDERPAAVGFGHGKIGRHAACHGKLSLGPECQRPGRTEDQLQFLAVDCVCGQPVCGVEHERVGEKRWRRRKPRTGRRTMPAES